MTLSSKSVIKHSATVQISNTINLIERRAWNVLLANAYRDLQEKELYEVDYEEYSKALGIEKRRNKQYVENYLARLVSARVEWNVLGKVSKEDWGAEWGVSGLLASAVIKRVEGRKKIIYSYSYELRKRLYHPRLYARISLSMQNKFNSKHALALYELCVDYFIAKKSHGQSPFISIDDFRKIMGIKDSEYREFKFLKQWIIKRPLQEINSKSDLQVDAEFQKQQRKVVALKLYIKPKKTISKLLSVSTEVEKTNEDLHNRLVQYFQLSASQAKEVLSQFDGNDIAKNLEYVEKKVREGNVKSIGAYTLKAIRENYQIQPNLFEEEQRKKEKASKDKIAYEAEQGELKKLYDQEREQCAKQAEKNLSEEILDKLKEEARQFVENKHGKNFQFKKLLTDRNYRSRILECVNFPDFEEWGVKRKSIQL